MTPPLAAPLTVVRVQAFRVPLGWETYATVKPPGQAIASLRYIGTYASARAVELRVDRDAERFDWDVRERQFFGVEGLALLDDWRRAARIKPDGIWGQW